MACRALRLSYLRVRGQLVKLSISPPSPLPGGSSEFTMKAVLRFGTVERSFTALWHAGVLDAADVGDGFATLLVPGRDGLLRTYPPNPTAGSASLARFDKAAQLAIARASPLVQHADEESRWLQKWFPRVRPPPRVGDAPA